MKKFKLTFDDVDFSGGWAEFLSWLNCQCLPILRLNCLIVLGTWPNRTLGKLSWHFGESCLSEFICWVLSIHLRVGSWPWPKSVFIATFICLFINIDFHSVFFSFAEMLFSKTMALFCGQRSEFWPGIMCIVISGSWALLFLSHLTARITFLSRDSSEATLHRRWMLKMLTHGSVFRFYWEWRFTTLSSKRLLANIFLNLNVIRFQHDKLFTFILDIYREVCETMLSYIRRWKFTKWSWQLLF